MKRVLEEEWLDVLPAHDARAARSRKDLRRLNRIMNHAGIINGLLHRLASLPGPRTLADLGAGDGSFALNLTQRLRSSFPISKLTLVDRNAVVAAETTAGFAAAGTELEIVRADVFSWLRQAEPATVIVANLFLHHFPAAALHELFTLLARRARIFVACEPRRCWLGLAATRGLGLLGCGTVTRHDAKLSVRAGFTGRELSAQWPSQNGWDLLETRRGPFSHAFRAQHIA
jgi:hypothetical protein